MNPAALVIAESGLNDPKVMREPAAGGWGCDAAWADDFHHALRVALTGETDGWYAEFASLGTLVKAFHRPHVHDGTWSSFRERRFGAPAEDVPPERFVVFSANHDQVGNRAFGDRLPVARAAARRAADGPVTVHADDLPGGGVRGDRAVPVLLRPHRRRDRGRDARGAAARVRGVRLLRARDPRPAGPRDVRRLHPDARRRARRPRDLYTAALALRRELGSAAAEASLDGRRLTVRRGRHRILANFGEDDWALDGEPVLVAGALRDGALPPLAGAVVR